MLGRGDNPKSMAYVGNIASFFVYLLTRQNPGVSVINYADKPDMRVREIVSVAAKALGVRVRRIPCPRFVALGIGRAGDLASGLLGRPIPVSYERVLKFLADTSLPTARLRATGFSAPYDLCDAFIKTLVTEFKNHD
jgi:nucleoside-diphosphate-sugar epimerase